MGKPLHYFDSPGVINQQPEKAMLLGHIVAAWALAEDGIMSILQFLLETDRDVAETMHQNFTSTRSKLDLLLRLNAMMTTAKADRSEIGDLIKRATTLNTMRNKYIHARWVVSDGHPGLIGRMAQTLPQAGGKKVRHEVEWLSVEIMKEDLKAIARWTQDCSQALFDIDPTRLNKAPRFHAQPQPERD